MQLTLARCRAACRSTLLMTTTVATLVLVAAPTTSAETGRSFSSQGAAAHEAARTEWKDYIAELSASLAKGIDPSEDVEFQKRQVEFDGTVKRPFNPSTPKESVVVAMDPQPMTIAVRLFPGVKASVAGDSTITVEVTEIHVSPAEPNRPAWTALKSGDRVRFRATVGTVGVGLITLTSGSSAQSVRGLVMLFLERGEVVPSKPTASR